MKLPNAENAVIAPEKLREYLLNAAHRKGGTKARLLVQVYPRSQSLTKPVATSRWKTSPDTRMMQLLHDTGIRLGIVTNGDHWMLVNAPKNETTGYASWYANLWLEEKDTLRAFRTLLCADRFFSVPAQTEPRALRRGSEARAAREEETTKHTNDTKKRRRRRRDVRVEYRRSRLNQGRTP